MKIYEIKEKTEAQMKPLLHIYNLSESSAQ